MGFDNGPWALRWTFCPSGILCLKGFFLNIIPVFSLYPNTSTARLLPQLCDTEALQPLRNWPRGSEQIEHSPLGLKTSGNTMYLIWLNSWSFTKKFITQNTNNKKATKSCILKTFTCWKPWSYITSPRRHNFTLLLRKAQTGDSFSEHLFIEDLTISAITLLSIYMYRPPAIQIPVQIRTKKNIRVQSQCDKCEGTALKKSAASDKSESRSQPHRNKHRWW